MSLKAEHIFKSFAGQPVLKDVSLEIAKGKILSLTGESGCGKSTLLRIIAGLEIPDSGKVLLDTQEITRWTPERRRFGFVFQNLALFPHLRVIDNVLFGLKRKHQNQSKISQLLQMTGLTGLESRYPHQLSGGQQQRVALARALAIDPEILILDEPFSSLDELLKAKIREEIFELLKSLGITTILVSHQPSDAFLIADHLVVMKSGEIQQEGIPSEVYKNPVSLYVSNFFGASVIINGEGTSNMIATPFGKLKVKANQAGSVQLFIRPENISVTDEKNSNLTGTIIKKEFKGPHDVFKIQSPDLQAVFDFETERTDLQVGDAIFLNVPEDKIQIF